ncbi:Protein kinase domain-containing protein [Promicromonospora umidemergens]|uniref:non-specific serine/threonine protein kinase n=1 Tax=Promicromonospora umidemergens TaxID=629679 RepID=A0ABP8XCQ4_9MICO|nr:protein kinase [Promicromonospora umidemergens]MCP2281564.1 Protein kinase domain-containing protein [Promicromonospora umidemergens]
MRLLTEGRRIGDTYEVERYLGQGACSEVYRVRHQFLGRQAMKVLKRVGTLAQTRRMLGEAVLLSKIGHPNILVGFDQGRLRVRVGDFGLARRADAETGLTSSEGTLAFMAPEALRYGQGASPAGDVYAVGTVAYLLLTDLLPYEDVPLTVFGAQHRQPPISPRDLNRDVGHELARVVLRALAPDLPSRPADAAELGRELAPWRVGGRAGTAPGGGGR